MAGSGSAAAGSRVRAVRRASSPQKRPTETWRSSGPKNSQSSAPATAIEPRCAAAAARSAAAGAELIEQTLGQSSAARQQQTGQGRRAGRAQAHQRDSSSGSPHQGSARRAAGAATSPRLIPSSSPATSDQGRTRSAIGSPTR